MAYSSKCEMPVFEISTNDICPPNPPPRPPPPRLNKNNKEHWNGLSETSMKKKK